MLLFKKTFINIFSDNRFVVALQKCQNLMLKYKYSILSNIYDKFNFFNSVFNIFNSVFYIFSDWYLLKKSIISFFVFFVICGVKYASFAKNCNPSVAILYFDMCTCYHEFWLVYLNLILYNIVYIYENIYNIVYTCGIFTFQNYIEFCSSNFILNFIVQKYFEL